MNWEKINHVWDALEDIEANPTGWGIFGIGGWLRNTPNRDSLSSAYKLCAMGRYPHQRPIIKLSDTLAKVSVPGPTVMIRNGEGMHYHPTVYFQDEWTPQENMHEAYQVYYHGHPVAMEDTFADHRNRAITQFDAYRGVPSNRGTPDNSPLSSRIMELQQQTMEKHGKDIGTYRY